MSAHNGLKQFVNDGSLPSTISTGCPELDLAWQTYASMILNRSQILIPDTDDDLTWHAFLGHSIDMQGFRAAEFAGVDPLTRDSSDFVPLKTRGIGVPELAALWEVPAIRQHLLRHNKDIPLAETLDELRTHGGEIGASLADAFDHFPWRKFHWSVRALLQNSAVLKPFDFSFRRWLQHECEQLGLQEFPPTNFRRAVTFEGTKMALERALRKRLEKTFHMVGPAMSAYMLCDWQLWLWREGLTAVFSNFKLDTFHEAFVKKFGKRAIPADEEGFAHWWHDLLPDLPPRLANECIWLSVEKKLVDPWTAPKGGTATKDGYTLEEWEKAKEEIRQILIGRAKLRQTIPYSDLDAQIKAIDLPRNSHALWDMLGEISTEEDSAGRGMLTIIVVHGKGDMLPGAGFFHLAKRLGRDTSDRRAFCTQEMRRVYRSWSAEQATDNTGDQESHGRVAADEWKTQPPSRITSMDRIVIMPRLSQGEVWTRVRDIDGQRITSLTGSSSHRVALVGEAERRYEVQYNSGNTAIVGLDELYALYSELYAHGSLTNSYMRDNVRRILGWDSWNRPGSAMFAILPLIDDAIQIVGGSLRIR